MEKTFINDEQMKKENLWNKEMWSQQEVANHFRVTSGTIRNWRKKGLLSYFQAPGSTRKQYFRDEIRDFKKTNSVMKVDYSFEPHKKLYKEKPVKSNNLHNEDWRI